MYLSFYKLLERPFSISTDPRFLWCGEKHQEALANLKYGLLQANGYVVLTGDVGTGKTTLVNSLIEALDDNVIVAYINHPTLDTLDFFDLVAKNYGISTENFRKSDFLFSFSLFLQKSHADGKIVLLIIDEAHCLSKELLEEIRLLSNFHQDGTQVLNIFFVGQNEFKEVMQGPECRALRQRITLFYEIEPLLEDETRAYVEHRLKIAGVVEQLFTPAAIRKVYYFTRGYPRVINILCDRALLTGYVNEKKEIGVAIIKECIRELDSLAPGTSKFSTYQIGKTIESGRSGGSSLVKKYRYPLVQGGAIVVFALGLVALGISMRNESPVKPDVPAMVDRTVVDKNKVSISETNPLQTENRAGPVSAGPLMEAPKRVSQTLNEDPPKLTDNEEGLENELPVATGIAPTANVLSVEATPAEEELLPQSQSADVPVAVPPAATQPTTLESALAALKENDFQTAIDLFEADQNLHSADNSVMQEAYSRALVGRAQQILKSSPAMAKTLLLKAVEINPENIEGQSNLGKIYIQSKDYGLAIDAYQKVVDLNPKLSDAFFNLGFLYATTNMYEDAENRFIRVVELEPPYLDKALFNLAVIQEKLGKKEECLANLKLAMTISPENKKYQSYLEQFKGDVEESQ